MTPAGFRLYDLLNLAATAVSETGSGRPGFADHAWLNAWASAEALFPAGTELAVILAEVTRAVSRTAPVPGREAAP